MNGYPLKISPSIVDDACKTISQELNPQFIRKMLQRMDYPSLVDAAKSVSAAQFFGIFGAWAKQ